MKLEVGMYVRYIAEFKQNDVNKKIVKIGKIIKNEDDYIELDTFNNRGMSPIEYFAPTIIGEPSFDIIDLIEVGDYVNGEKVGYIDDLTGAMRQFNYDYENAMKNCGHWQEEIKTILTKEQFENNCYKVGD